MPRQRLRKKVNGLVEAVQSGLNQKSVNTQLCSQNPVSEPDELEICLGNTPLAVDLSCWIDRPNHERDLPPCRVGCDWRPTEQKLLQEAEKVQQVSDPKDLEYISTWENYLAFRRPGGNAIDLSCWVERPIQRKNRVSSSLRSRTQLLHKKTNRTEIWRPYARDSRRDEVSQHTNGDSSDILAADKAVEELFPENNTPFSTFQEGKLTSFESTNVFRELDGPIWEHEFDMPHWSLRPDDGNYSTQNSFSVNFPPGGSPRHSLQTDTPGDLLPLETVSEVKGIKDAGAPLNEGTASDEPQRSADTVQDVMSEVALQPPILGQECPYCHRHFTVRKSMLRHVHTVHRPKTFTCAHCVGAFARKDIRDRHVAEQHSDKENTIRCTACGRYLSRRAFAEHLDSELCREARSTSEKANFNELSVKFVGADDDPFLAALRMLRLFGPDEGSETVGYVRLRLRPRHFHDTSVILRYENCVVRLMIDKLTEREAPLRAMGMTALLLGFMALAGRKTYGGKALTHFQGAARLFKACHDSMCHCNHHRSCPCWSPFAPRSPEVGLLNRLLGDIGVDHRLLEAYTPEEEAALGSVLAGSERRNSASRR